MESPSPRLKRSLPTPARQPTAPVRRTERVTRSRPPSATWRDIKQLGWAVLLVVPYVAVVCFGAAALVGWRAAFWVAVGLVSLTAVTFALLVVLSLLVTLVDDFLQSRLHARRS